MIILHSLYDEVRQVAKTMSFRNLTITRDVKASLSRVFLPGKINYQNNIFINYLAIYVFDMDMNFLNVLLFYSFYSDI